MSTVITDDSLIDDEEDFVLPRKERVDEEMDITPMIDITFLLLIFFVVCSTMDPAKMGDIPSAKNGTGVSDDDSAIIFIDALGPTPWLSNVPTRANFHVTKMLR